MGAGQDLLSDLQGTLAQGLRLPVPPALPVEHSQVVEGGGHLQGRGGRSGVVGSAPWPSLLGPHSPQGAQGPASAPGSAGHHGEGLWPLCTCSGPCDVAQGWRGVSHAGAAPAGPSLGGRHPSTVACGSPHTFQVWHSVPLLSSLQPPQVSCLWLSDSLLGSLASPDPCRHPLLPPIQVPHAGRVGRQLPCPQQWVHGRPQPSPVHQRQDVEHGGHIGVAVARAPFQVL